MSSPPVPFMPSLISSSHVRFCKVVIRLADRRQFRPSLQLFVIQIVISNECMLKSIKEKVKSSSVQCAVHGCVKKQYRVVTLIHPGSVV